MKFSVRTRACALTLAAGGLLLVPLATPASAVNQPATCSKLATKTVNKVITVTLSGCTPLAATGGSATGSVTNGSGVLKGKTVIKVTWAGGKGTTTSTIAYAPNTKGRGKCAVGSTRLITTGKVVSSTGAAAKVIKAGQPTTASACVTKTLSSSLEPGTLEKL